MILTIFTYLIIIGLIAKIYAKLSCGIFKSSRHLIGKTVIVTGSNAGIGYETSRNLAERGARVLLACRDRTRGETAAKKIREETGNKDVHYRNLDLASLKNIRDFAENILRTEKRLDILINNAGAFGLGNRKTEDGLLAGMQVNHFGHFLLTNLLLPLLKSSAPSRIINVSSLAHVIGRLDFQNLNMEKESDKTFSEFIVYATSKLYNNLFTVELDRRLKGTGVTANSCHPGGVITNILYNIDNKFINYLYYIVMNLFYKNVWEGCQTQVHLAVEPRLEKVSGLYFSDCKPAWSSGASRDKKAAMKLWEESERLVKL